MLTKYTYWAFQSELKPEICEKIINLGNSKIIENKKLGIDTSGTTFGGEEKQKNPNAVSQGDKTLSEIKDKKTYIRDSEVSWLTDKWLYELILPYVSKANKNAGWNYDWDLSESFQFTKYGLGGLYGWHTDCGTDKHASYHRRIPGLTVEEKDKNYTTDYKTVGKIRKISVTINLNKPGEYEGGNLKFDYGPHFKGERYKECTEIRPQGSIIVFPSYIHHQVTPITKGTRYSLVLWNLGNPFK